MGAHHDPAAWYPPGAGSRAPWLLLMVPSGRQCTHAVGSSEEVGEGRRVGQEIKHPNIRKFGVSTGLSGESCGAPS